MVRVLLTLRLGVTLLGGFTAGAALADCHTRGLTPVGWATPAAPHAWWLVPLVLATTGVAGTLAGAHLVRRLQGGNPPGWVGRLALTVAYALTGGCLAWVWVTTPGDDPVFFHWHGYYLVYTDGLAHRYDLVVNEVVRTSGLPRGDLLDHPGVVHLVDPTVLATTSVAELLARATQLGRECAPVVVTHTQEGYPVWVKVAAVVAAVTVATLVVWWWTSSPGPDPVVPRRRSLLYLKHDVDVWLAARAAARPTAPPAPAPAVGSDSTTEFAGQLNQKAAAAAAAVTEVSERLRQARLEVEEAEKSLAHLRATPGLVPPGHVDELAARVDDLRRQAANLEATLSDRSTVAAVADFMVDAFKAGLKQA